MFKILITSILLLGSISSAEAKVCFLPDLMGNDEDCLQISFGNCENYPFTTRCPSAYITLECQDTKGKMHYQCICQDGNIRTDISRNGNTKYHCLDGFTSECGCSKTNTVCNPEIYKYKQTDCARLFPNTIPVDDCLDYRTGTTLYATCKCLPEIYPYSCTETGFLPVDTPTTTCTNSNGDKAYSLCQCKYPYTETVCNNRTDGCTATVATEKNLDTSCYHCGPEKCSDNTKLNLENYWYKHVPSTLETNCQALGYEKIPADNAPCADGSSGIKCVFDNTYRYCSKYVGS